MKKLPIVLTFLCLTVRAGDVWLHIDSVTPNYAMTGPSNNIALTKAEITITGLTAGDRFTPLKSGDGTNWLGDIGTLTATSNTFHYQSYNADNIYPGMVFYRVAVAK